MRKGSKTGNTASDGYMQTEANKKTDAELLCLITAYRKTGHAKGSARPSADQNAFTVALFAAVEALAGTSERPGRLAKQCGLAHRVEDLVAGMKSRLLNNLERDGSYLASWNQAAGNSIMSTLWSMGKYAGLEMGRQSVIDAIRASPDRRLAKPRGAGGAECDKQEMKEEESIRLEADRLIKEFREAKKKNPSCKPPDLPGVDWKAISDFEPGNGAAGDDGHPSVVPAQLRVSIESPMVSALRVRPILTILKVVGDEMAGKTIIVDGKETLLTVNHRNIWYAFLALTPEQHQYLDDSIVALGEKNGWSQSTSKRWLADCFVFFEGHRLFEQCCDLLPSGRESKRMDSNQLAVVRTKSKQFLEGEVPKYSDKQEEEENARDMFRKAIHHWVEKYGEHSGLHDIGDEMPGRTVVVNGRSVTLNSECRVVWITYLRLDNDTRQQFNKAIREIGARLSIETDRVRAHLASSFVYYLKHRLFANTIGQLGPAVTEGSMSAWIAKQSEG